MRNTSSVNRCTNSRPAGSATRRPNRCSCRRSRRVELARASRNRVSASATASSLPPRRASSIDSTQYPASRPDEHSIAVGSVQGSRRGSAAGHGGVARRRAARDVLRQGPVRHLSRRQSGIRRSGRGSRARRSRRAPVRRTCSRTELATSYIRQDAELWSSRQPLRNQLELITPARRDARLVRHHQGARHRCRRQRVPGQPLGRPARRRRCADGTCRRRRSGRLRPPSLHRARARWRRGRGRVDVGGAARTDDAADHRHLGTSAIGAIQGRAGDRAVGHDATCRCRTSPARCGYYDQSAFTRQFRRVVGVSPGAYRSQGLRR